eukprot:gene12183-2801_t
MAAGDSLVVWRRCTPFCEKSVDCPEHHELLQAIVNCTDQLGHLSNLEILKNCVEKYESLGWEKNDDIPDPVISNRYPLVHWAASLGKCNALEWMVHNNFDKCVTVTGLGENALHRSVLCLYKSRSKFTVKELKPKFTKIVSLLSPLLSMSDDVNRDTPLHTAASMLLNTDVRVGFFQMVIEVMASFTNKMPAELDRTDILDARNNDGDTGLHILAGVADRGKAEYACSAITALIQANADKTIRNNAGQTPLDIAIVKGFDNIIDELVKIGPSKPLSTPLKDHDNRKASQSPCTMVPSRRSPSRPSSNESCSTADSVKNGGFKKGSSSSLHEDKNGTESMSPVDVKQEPGSPSGDSPYQGDFPESDVANMDAADLLRNVSANSTLLQHLQEAGLLTEVSSLLLRAKVRDEAHLKKIQQQAKDLDTQIRYKKHEIEKINQEVELLFGKRKKCEDDASQLRKRLNSCQNAIKEIPSKKSNNSNST